MSLVEAVIYCRASKDRTGAGLSVVGQETDCREFARRHHLAVRAVYADNDITAAGHRPRPAYRRMLADLAERPAAVIVWHTDRLHRHPAELEEYIRICEQRRITTHAVRVGELDLATPSGRLVARMLGAAAKHELEIMSQRRRDGKARAAAAGQWKGGRRPFGYEADGVTVIAAEAALIATGSEAVLAGVSLAGVTRAWNASGIATSTGRRWLPREVSRVLQRPRNAGLMQHQGKVVEGIRAEWAAVVNEDTWRGVVAMLSDPARRTSPGPERRWLLSGIAVCGICGTGLIVSRTSGQGRPMRPVYRCRPLGSRKRHVARDSASLDGYVTEIVITRLSRPDAADTLRSAREDGVPDLHARMTVARQRLDEAAGLYADGVIDARQLSAVTVKLNSEMEAAGQHLAAIAERNALAAFTAAQPGRIWDSLDLDSQRAVIRALMRVTVQPAPKGRPAGWKPGDTYFAPDCINIEWHR